MKKQNTLRTVSALTVSLVLAVFLTTCEDGGYEPTVRGIRFGYELDIDTVINGKEDELMVICDIPSSIKEITLKLEFDPSYIESITDKYSSFHEKGYDKISPITTDPIPRDYDIRYDDDDKYAGTYLPFPVKVKSPTAGTIYTTITVTAEPGGVSATCPVTIK